MSEDATTPTAPQPDDWKELATSELRQQREALQQEISELTSRRDALQEEINSSFAGQSDSIARRVKGFQDYLVGALQELAVSAEQMELVVQPLVVQPSPASVELRHGLPKRAERHRSATPRGAAAERC